MIKKTTTLLFLISFFQFFNLASQEKENIEDFYLQYFKLPRESIFIHTNKTTFLVNEEIWFRTYALDRKNNLSSKRTTNIYLGLYNDKGEQIDKKLFLAKDGMASGNFSFNPELPSGEYYLKASTNWMKNFTEDDAFIQKIYIINGSQVNNKKKPVAKQEFDFQLLPEGGNILENVKNTIGFKCLDDKGKGIYSSGKLLNSKKEIITTFKSNLLGIGKFSFTPKQNENYTVEISVNNGKNFIQKISKIEKVGIALSLNNLNSKRVILNFSTNNNSFNLLKGKNYKILISKDGNIKSIPLIFDEKTKQISILKKDLLFGTNTITLFNEDQKPILERLFFNNSKPINATDLTFEFVTN